MDTNYAQVYTDAVLALASSLVVKSSDTANAINLKLQIERGESSVDLQTPQTWKYYLNLVGEYHPTDQVMQVVSVDTLQTIDFTLEVLQFHRGTQAAYAYGTTAYLELINRYPEQELLILGILYPAPDLQAAIDAKDGTILSYPSFLVEENEYSLIPKLQDWIYSYYVRWLNPQYGLSDDLYIPVFLGVMYINLIPAIISFRLKACKTNEAHSYHIRQYLASHGLLDVYLEYLTRSQALFLYRNICYIERNSGKRATFEWLMQHLLTERGLPLAEFEMRHDLKNMPDQLKPVVVFQKNPLNTDQNYDGVNAYTLPQIFDKENPLAKDNSGLRDVEQLRSERLMEYSLSSRLKTKLLESSIIDYTGSEHYTLSETLLNHWISLSHSNHYRAYVQVKSPVTDETISLSAKDAFVFYFYMVSKRLGVTLLTVPTVIAKRVIRTPRPTVDDIMSVVNPDVFSEAEAQTMLSMLPVPQPMISVESFYDYCVSLHRASLAQYYLVTSENTMSRYSQRYSAMNRAWADVGIDLSDDGTQEFFADWFAKRNILISELTSEDFAIMEVQLLEAATDVDSSKAITVKQIQSAMVQLMAQLSSYSVQFVATINDGPLVDANTGSSRIDDVKETSGFLTEILTPLSAFGFHSHLAQEIDFDVENIGEITLEIGLSSFLAFEVTVGPEFTELRTRQFQTLLVSTDFSYPLSEPLPNPRRLTPVAGIDSYLNLSLDQQLSIPDLWH